MDQFFVIILIFLTCLATFDLFIGVSNDAANFLSAAIGSSIAPLKVVLLVASIGVLFGATFSSGMMEIARSGVFNPQMFTFAQIMLIFFAVMNTDVLMLDRFNALGLPTSTTVSIIFSLLGGAVSAAVITIWREQGSLLSVAKYINDEKALAIIFGILISVVVAFAAGSVVQFITRIIFTFRYQNAYRYLGGLLGGIALTSIFYFLVMKGAKGASFMKPEYIEFIDTHTWSIVFWLCSISTIIFQCLIIFLNANIFKFIILSGTFALAFAFAGNDLVNFVGVPIAAFDSYLLYQQSPLAADVMIMESLKEAAHTPTIFLLLSGAVMVSALWFSRKAHHVMQTSINLSSSAQDDTEQFGSSLPARTIVHSAILFGKALRKILPTAVFSFINKRMEKPPLAKGEIELPFDQVRASINLVVASILIASATSLKLPLSTTYVTFMVAMGSSFADGAWDRESAVYRISGVLTVITGWFVTALCAFSISATITAIVFFGGSIAVVILMLITAAIIIHSNFLPKSKKEKEEELKEAQEEIEINAIEESDDKNAIRESVNKAVSQNLNAVISLYRDGINAFLDEDVSAMKIIRNEVNGLFDKITKRRKQYYRMAKQGNKDKGDNGVRHLYYRAFTNMREVAEGLKRIINTAKDHIANHHHVYTGVLKDNLMQMLDIMQSMQIVLEQYAQTGKMTDVAFSRRSGECVQHINQLQLELLRQIDEAQLSLRGSELYLSFLQFARETIDRYTIVVFLQRELNTDSAG